MDILAVPAGSISTGSVPVTNITGMGTGVQIALQQPATGTGSPVLATSPTLTAPNLGTPSAVNLTNGTALPIGTGVSGLGAGVATALEADVTGSGSIVLSTSPALIAPALDTPSAGVLTNCTGLPVSSGLAGTGTGVPGALAANVTGSGGIVLATGPTLINPNLGTPSAATLTNATGLPLATGVSGLGTNVATALAVAATGTAGGVVRATSPSITTPSFPGGISSVNGIATVGPGVEILVAKYDATAQQANISTSTVLYTVPSGGAGLYRIHLYIVVTQAASGGTPSSTMPNAELLWTDNDSGVSETMFLGTTSSANAVGTFTQTGGLSMYAKTSTNIQFGTSGYASAGTTPMQFAIHIRVCYLG